MTAAPNEPFHRSVEENKMFRMAKTAMKYFAFGLIAGLLLAPQSGARTRQMIGEKVQGYLGMFMGMVPSGKTAMEPTSRVPGAHPEGVETEAGDGEEIEERIH
jgi:hypothetical protein